VTFHWKSGRLVVCAALLALCAGCSGINTSHGVSPASFLLPGLLKADPPQETEPLMPDEKPLTVPEIPAAPEPASTKQVALAR
jgi:hypothetical protein